MALINWNESLDLGIAEIDLQHREMAHEVNALQRMASEGATQAEMRTKIRSLMQIIEHHFATEERIFNEYSYPDADSHAQIHRTLENQLRELIRNIDSGAIPFSDTILAFVKDWFLTHTTGSDLVYAVWMKRQGFIKADTKELIPRR